MSRYLCSAPTTLETHLRQAQQQGFRLGAKLVRGAYIQSEPRHLIWPTIEETHLAYNNAISTLARRKGEVDLVVATHNKESVEHARQLDRDRRLIYAQLKGMGDDLSYLLAAEHRRVIKYVCWGSLPECLLYLERRAIESNGGEGFAAREVLWRELGRRLYLIS